MAKQFFSVDTDMIIRTACEKFNIPIKEIGEQSRRRPHVFARQMIMYIIRNEDPYVPLINIANLFNRKDHTTVMHAITGIQNKLDVNDPIKEIYDQIIYTIKTNENK